MRWFDMLVQDLALRDFRSVLFLLLSGRCCHGCEIAFILVIVDLAFLIGVLKSSEHGYLLTYYIVAP